MTAVAWQRPVRRRRRRTRRDEIFEWVCHYADEMDGPTPSINEIAVHFKLNYKTVYYHVMKLIVEGRLRQERGKLVVVGSEWIEPSGPTIGQRFDFEFTAAPILGKSIFRDYSGHNMPRAASKT
jgi:hypothetical protein